jgi:hypothetical protein
MPRGVRLYRIRAMTANTIYTCTITCSSFTPSHLAPFAVRSLPFGRERLGSCARCTRLHPHARLRDEPPHRERHEHNPKQDQPYAQRQILVVPQLNRRRVDAPFRRILIRLIQCRGVRYIWLVTASIVFLVVSWVVVSDNSLRAWLARAAPEKAPSVPLVHAPFCRLIGLVPTKLPGLGGQNTVCARTSAGFPSAIPAPMSNPT